jgi:hypothetical protein
MCRMNELSIKHHIKHLEDMHKDLDKQVQEDYKHFGNDNLVSVLKKKKLQIKDDIERLKRQLETL